MPPRRSSAGAGVRTGVPLAERVARAWARHPLVAFARHRSLVTFYRQLGALLASGTPLPTAFEQLVTYAPDERMARALRQVAREVQAGGGLAEALGRRAAELDDVHVELIAFAEESGTLEPVLDGIVERLEQLQSLRWRLVVLMLWPAYLLVSVLLAGPLLEVARTARPGASLGAMYLASLGQSVALFAALAGGLFVAPLAIAALGLDGPWDRLKRALPLVSRSVEGLYRAKFLATLAMGSAAGLEIHRMLRASALATRSPSVLAALPAAEEALRRGATLTDSVASLGLLDRPSLGALAVGEGTGTLDEVLRRTAAELEKSAVRSTQVLMVVLVVGLAVVLLVKAVAGLLGVLLGPVKRLYDAAGTGDLEKL